MIITIIVSLALLLPHCNIDFHAKVSQHNCFICVHIKKLMLLTVLLLLFFFFYNKNRTYGCYCHFKLLGFWPPATSANSWKLIFVFHQFILLSFTCCIKLNIQISHGNQWININHGGGALWCEWCAAPNQRIPFVRLFLYFQF